MHYVKDSSSFPFHLSLYPLALEAAELHDDMTTKQLSRGGAAMFVY